MHRNTHARTLCPTTDARWFSVLTARDPLTRRRKRHDTLRPEVAPLRPEDDILAQWRAARRRELAQAGLKPATPVRVAALLHRADKPAATPTVSQGHFR